MIVLINKNLWWINPNWSNFKFIIYYDKNEDKTIAILFTSNNNKRIVKSFPKKTYNDLFEQIIPIINLPHSDKTKVYDGDELAIYHKTGIWRNVSPDSCTCIYQLDCKCGFKRWVPTYGGILGNACGCKHSNSCNMVCDYQDRIALEMRNGEKYYFAPTRNQQDMYDYATNLIFQTMRSMFKNDMVVTFYKGI